MDAQRSAGNLNRIQDGGLHLEECEKCGGREHCDCQNDRDDNRVEPEVVTDHRPVGGRLGLGGVAPTYGGWGWIRIRRWRIVGAW